MAIVVSQVLVNTPEYKVFDITSIESDLVGAATVWLFVNAGMTNLRGIPEFCIMKEITNGVVCTVENQLSMSAMATTGFTVVKTSIANGASPVLHTFRVYMGIKRAYEV